MKPSKLNIHFKDPATDICYCRDSSALINRTNNGFNDIGEQLAINTRTAVESEIKRKAQPIGHEGQIRVTGNAAIHP
jgi:hypothetical protein